MKTQLIPLESHDDLISVRDRMSWAKTPRILLIWPISGPVNLRAVDLKVLQRHAASLGAQVGLVTRQNSIQRTAQELNIPVFHSTGEAQRLPWPEKGLGPKVERRAPRKDLRALRAQIRVQEAAWRGNPAVRFLTFTIGVLAILAIGSLFIPRAQIILRPEKRTQTVILPILADPALKSVFITGRIPSYELSLIKTDSLEALTTGEISVPRKSATGIVNFRNLTQKEVSLPSGTILTSIGLPGVRFLTTESGSLVPGLNTTLDVPIQAESAGATGNVEPNSILAIQGDLALVVAVTNELPTSGGRDLIIEAASESDLARLRKDLMTEMENQVLAEAKGLLNSTDQLFPDSLRVEQVLEEKYDPPIGQASLEVTLSLRIEFKTSYASGDDIEELAIIVLNASQPEGFVVTGDTLSFETEKTYQTDKEGTTRWVTRVTRTLEEEMDIGKIIGMLQGRSKTAGLRQLENNLDLPSNPEILLNPDWWPWLPLIPFNITVVTK
ncbi:MAG: baseplate J/gp47 family protein [Anaerolineae bacterium]|nr:baseplate J/gp47 family protein [Anaerolineae bacterium]